MRLREQHDLADAPLAGLLPRLEAAASETHAVNRRRAGRACEVNRAGARRIAESRHSRSVPTPASGRSLPPASPPEPLPAPPRLPCASPAEKLDALLARSGELLVARRRVERASEDLAALQESVSAGRPNGGASRSRSRSSAETERTMARRPQRQSPTTQPPPCCRAAWPRAGPGGRQPAAAGERPGAADHQPGRRWPAARAGGRRPRRRGAPRSACCPSPRPARGWNAWSATWPRPAARRSSWSSRAATSSWIARCWKG